MGTFIAILILLGMIGFVLMFIVGMISPKRALPKSIENPTRGKVLGFSLGGLILMVVLLIVINPGKLDSDSANNSNNAVTVTAEQKEQAKNDALAILQATPQSVDEVEKVTWYKSWGTDKYPPISNVYWTAKVDGDKKVSQHLKFVHFDSGIDWVFWDKVIFSTDQGKWELKLNTFAGQSGDGKNTQIVMGGKYETLDIPYDKAYEGIKLLLEGTNPIIRYQGEKAKYDYHVPAETLQELQRSMQLHQDLKLINNSLQ